MATKRLAAVYRPGKPMEVLETAQTYEEMKKLIGGHFEHVGWGNLDIWVDEEGILKDLPATVQVTGFNYPFLGPVVVFVKGAKTADQLLEKLAPLVRVIR